MAARRALLRWRRVWQFAAAAALCFTRHGLRMHRSLEVAPTVTPLVLPTRWPACSPDGAGGRRGDAPRHALVGADGRRYAIVSTWLPTRCGIATFSAGLRGGLLAGGALAVDVLAVHLRSNGPPSYGPEVRVPRS
jgi:hypothetical protein